MAICVACQKNSFFTSNVANMCFCKSCYKIIQGEKLEGNIFTTNAAVELEKQKVLTAAYNNKFSTYSINELEKFFDEKIENGLIERFDGTEGQVLTIYRDRFSIVTESYFDGGELAGEYSKLRKKSVSGSGLVSATVGGILSGGLKGGLVKAGLSAFKSAAMSSGTEVIGGMLGARDELKSITIGEQIVYYEECKQSELFLNENSMIGCIVFHLEKKELLFIFDSSLDKRAQNLHKKLCEEIHRSKTTNPGGRSNLLPTSGGVADELVKYKQLLDSGVISEAEFADIKRKLLN